jgi:hypothetical protein
MHSQPPGRRRRDNQPPGPDGPYEQEPPYQQQHWQPQPGPSYQPPPNGPHNQPPWEPSNGAYQQPRPNGPYQEPSGGGPYQQPPGAPYQPQPPRRKRRLGLKITLGIVGGVILLIIVAAALGGGNSGTNTSTNTAAGTGTGNSQAAQSAGSAAAPGIGDKVRDGKFEFTVIKVTHAKSVGDTQFGLGETAQGRFTIITLRVTNIGNESQTLDDSSQLLFDSRGRKFSADSAADIDLSGANGQGSTWLDDINPGNTVHGKIAFDMPVGDKAVKIELHDSLFSDGVTVKLR